MKSKTSNGNIRSLLRWETLLIIIAVVVAVAMIATSATRPLTPLETTLFQLVTLGAGIAGSFLLGRASAAQAARDVIRPHARSALRQLLVLRDSLRRSSDKIEEFKASGDDPRLDIIQAILDEQIPMERSAIEDWRDIVPDDVEEVSKQWQEGYDDGSSD